MWRIKIKFQPIPIEYFFLKTLGDKLYASVPWIINYYCPASFVDLGTTSRFPLPFVPMDWLK